MIILLSPAKSLDLSPLNESEHTFPALQSESNKLAKVLKQFKQAELQELMNISETLAKENAERIKNFKLRAPFAAAKRAIEIFAGDVYRGLNVEDFTHKDFQFAQEHVRILSGLYGVLRPLDKIQPYRLEMGTRLRTQWGKNLYEFWGDKITKQINLSLKDQNDIQIINLASDEYFKSLKKDKLKAKILHIQFKEYHDGSLKFLSYNAKIARGMMARYIVKNQITSREGIKGFDYERYAYDESLSSPDSWMFIR